MKEARRSGIVDSIAASAGLALALFKTVIPSMLAEGAGEFRAWIRDSSDARRKICVNETGPRSLIARLARTAGSC
jgi:hypothetical protein